MNYDELKELLEKVDFDGSEIQLDKATKIIDQEKFYKAHCAMIEGNRGNKRFMPYYNRLLKFYEYYKTHENTTD